MIRSLRLSAGMLTILPAGIVMDPSRATARGALLLAPIAVAPLGLALGAVLWLGAFVSVPPLAIAILAITSVAVLTRFLHLDGLSDVADGLTAPYGPERSLAIMKTGASGPAGTAALLIVMSLQAVCLARLVATDHSDWRHPLLGAACVMASRLALWISACSAFPPARDDGLGQTFTRSIPVVVAALGWGLLSVASSFLSPERAPMTVGLAALAVAVLCWRCTRQFGGVTGDVFGAAIEVALAVLLIGAVGIDV
ncbi:adenosylcobinamide-GDP ribazoletransferase [Nocardioides montaniterrae]